MPKAKLLYAYPSKYPNNKNREKRAETHTVLASRQSCEIAPATSPATDRPEKILAFWTAQSIGHFPKNE
jgi:hypothetical protein